ncbi:MFS transporter [Planobispora longispora]|uniref:MFS transporter n=1 Tax=Planobispora longispora TaxID=28887 RepID=A0A8J3RSI9_9ACTN|nr:MFS transporter [Planobispora longispora]BFE84334.1 MFS transporter [Planobispora longispora]GIH79092.1 MFS transporter [Planobispora longispora]
MRKLTPSTASAPDPSAGGRGGNRGRDGAGLVTALAITQTAGYGVLYYAFAVLLTPMSRDLHAGTGQVAGALTCSVLTAALAAPWVGRLLDARGGRIPMTAGAVLGVAAVLAWSQVTSLVQLYAVLVLVGLASAMVLYEAAFAVVVAVSAPARRSRALLVITIVAGFASSVFFPLTGFLVAAFGWRTALVILAAVYGALAVPLHALILPGHDRARGGRTGASAKARRADLVRAALRGWAFWLLVAAFFAQIAAVAVMGVLLVAYLIALGHSAVLAAGVAGLLGVLSVTGRLVSTALSARRPIALVTAAIFALQGAAALLLPLIGRDTAGAIVAVTLFGLGFGVATIARPALLAERYGTGAYGSISGAMALPVLAAKAVAPLVAAVLVSVVGYTAVMAAVAACCALAAITLTAYHRIPFRAASK